MTQEDKRYLQDKLYHERDKELLLKDLCARLPYGVKCAILNKDLGFGGIPGFEGKYPFVIDGITQEGDDFDVWIEHGNFSLETVKPHLFPLSSLTEEQRNDISKLLIDTHKEYSPYGELNMKGCDNLFISTVKQANVLINYCLTHHLDINGLIEKGLAIDATGLNIY